MHAGGLQHPVPFTESSRTCIAGAFGRPCRGRISNSQRVVSQPSWMAWLSTSGNRPLQSCRIAAIRLLSATAPARMSAAVGSG